MKDTQVQITEYGNMWREKLGNNHSKTDMNVFQICATLHYDVIKRCD